MNIVDTVGDVREDGRRQSSLDRDRNNVAVGTERRVLKPQRGVVATVDVDLDLPAAPRYSTIL